MLVKCETKSNRVKGLSFHPKLSWIIASLHNGVIQLWDFRIGSLIERYEEHEGPVRGVDFHMTQPIFVSGGDDYRIKVWNYRQRRCIFTLLGHLDYIRTVQFHPEYPWILSSSDDQTVRIWNWQNRSCIAVLAGHNHYVMCAQFHLKQDLLVSASLDQTIRVWDVAGLREKTVSIRGSSGGVANAYGPNGAPPGTGGAGMMMMHPQQSDMFGTSDAVCKFILEGHDRGVNWAAFHPTLALIASGADDRLVKLWRYNESKWWEVDTFRGHFNNVSSVLFHPTRDLLLSNSEDRTIRVWDITKRILVHTFRRENDRFWILAALKNSNVVAVGHDSGMVVFKLDRERPAAQTVDSDIFYVKDKWITMYQCNSDQSVSITACRRPANAMSSGPRTLMVNALNPSELNILILYKEPDGSAYDLLAAKDAATAAANPSAIVTKQGSANGVAFVARNRFAVLETSGSISIMNLNNELSKRFEPPIPTDRLFYAGNNRLLLRSEEQLCLYDLTVRKTMAELNCPGGVRYAVWSPDNQHVALVCKHHVVLADSKLEYLCSVHENIRVKGGAWDPLGAFVYSTLSHIKYCIPNGDQGIMRCLAQPIYILRIEQQRLWAIDRDSQALSVISLNCAEYLFKLALHAKQFDQVALLIRQGRLCGNAVVVCLRNKGFPEVALQFVDDVKTRFNLALEDGNLEEATNAAIQLDDKACWERLGVEAMRQGNLQTTETVYQKTKNLEKLSFFYLITGNIVKLRKMLQIAEMRNDFQARFTNALLLGDVEERVRVLAETGQIPLAAVAAKINGLTEFTNALEDEVKGIDIDSFIHTLTKTVDLTPPKPLSNIFLEDSESLQPTTNWPCLASGESNFESALALTEKLTPEAAEALHLKLANAGTSQKKSSKAAKGIPTDPFTTLDEDIDEFDISGDLGGDGWADLDDMELPTALPGTTKSAGKTNGSLEDEMSEESEFIRVGEKPQNVWVKNQSSLAALVAAGQYDSVLETLSKRIGLINAEPLQPLFESIALASFVSLPLLPLLASKRLPLLESGSLMDGDHLPIHFISLTNLVELTRATHRLVTAGKIVEALAGYRDVLARLSLASAANAEEESQLLDLLSVVRTYTLAMRIESERQSLNESEEQRNVELAAYLGCCKLQPTHQFLVLRRAMTVAWKAHNFISAASFGRKLIQSDFSSVKGASEAIVQAKKVLAASEKKGTNKHDVDFDAEDIDNLSICAATLKRIASTIPTIKCSFCSAVATTDFNKQLCPVCQMGSLGARVLGIQFRSFA